VEKEEMLAIWAVEMFLQKEFPIANEDVWKNLKNCLDTLDL